MMQKEDRSPSANSSCMACIKCASPWLCTYSKVNSKYLRSRSDALVLRTTCFVLGGETRAWERSARVAERRILGCVALDADPGILHEISPTSADRKFLERQNG